MIDPLSYILSAGYFMYLFFFIFQLIPFLLAMTHLLRIKRPLQIKLMWGAICFLFGIIGALLYVVIVYFPEENKKK
jgi:hypothetical protein